MKMENKLRNIEISYLLNPRIGYPHNSLNAWGYNLTEYTHYIFTINGYSLEHPYEPPKLNGSNRIKILKKKSIKSHILYIVNDIDASSIEATWYSMEYLKSLVSKIIWICGSETHPHLTIPSFNLLKSFLNDLILRIIYIAKSPSEEILQNAIITTTNQIPPNLKLKKVENITSALIESKKIIQNELSLSGDIAIIYSPALQIPDTESVLVNFKKSVNAIF